MGTVLGAVAGLAVVDATLGVVSFLSPVFTAIECAAVLPWLLTVVRLDRAELRSLDRSTWARLRLVAVHLVLFGLVVLCLAEKWVVLAGAAGTEGSDHHAAYRIFTLAAAVIAATGLMGRGGRFMRFLAGVADHPARLMTLSFGLTALLGGFLLTLPQALRRIGDASFVDGLFTATSAVCVTGLTVNNVGETYTFFGQCVILALIQAGGLGIMVLSAFFAIVAGRSMRVRSSAVLAEMIDTDSIASLRRMVLAIVLYTVLFEGIGAASLHIAWSAHPDIALGPASDADLSGSGSLLWASIFHSVSAFCNAGFALFENGLVPLVGDVPTNLTIASLITVGGIGFPVIDELARAGWDRLRRRRPPRLSLHTRTVLLVSGALTAALTVLYLALEWRGSMEALTWSERLLAAVFQSVTTRTAGFNTIDFGAMGPAALLITCVWMFVGAAPGSTGGGIKVTTFATLLATFRAELRGRPAAHLLGRTLPGPVQRRALGVAFLSAALCATAVFALLLTERHEPLRVMFEVVSAFGTVGLSTGITGSLSVAGKLVITATMFIGRIGPLTLAVALAARRAEARIELPEERVMIG